MLILYIYEKIGNISNNEKWDHKLTRLKKYLTTITIYSVAIILLCFILNRMANNSLLPLNFFDNSIFILILENFLLLLILI